ncbi:MAG TPA: GNAT family N-acetyltransferase [Jiangellales bacterium]|nr:GNAT family N-acetyltransferase [Jiangellales bacterium]
MQVAEAELVAMANRSLVGSFGKLAEHSADGGVHKFGAVVGFVTGVPIPLFNGCLILQPVAAADIDAAVTWINRYDLPYQVWMSEKVTSGLSDVAAARGLEKDRWSLPGMVLCAPWGSPPAPPGIGVSAVDDGAALDTWLGVMTEVGMPREMAEGLFPPSFAADPDVMLFTAYLDGRPVGTSIAIRTGDVSGVYAVITLPGARRRGVGTAAAWAAVNAAREWGCDFVALQATEMGLSSYERMGFATVVRYAIFERRLAT